MGSYMELRTLTMIGGTALAETRTAMTSGCHVVVGTPGRIADMINRKVFVTKSIKLFVLDEADEMLDRGFIKDIRTIFGTMPPDVQVGLFSATLKEETMGITQRFMRDPLTILVKEEELTLDGIRQY
jgi:translation initiation factor 4A